ncbi:hypothetical protein GCM10027515_26260 [Schumannella luteola]|uniref:Uncharacterized protein n=1 Tax=Schumannella luteola TaxID=472059 RepID=A0A852Y9E0_9MICO|nr:hypothetical protein [Schumannella luteola]NYG99576.1 hypothetical protein [Schumannella luteola]TPX01983.1 hypothetical protein FJ656_24420 [Schumannella luteola]
MFVIEDELHAEEFGRYESRDEAMDALRVLAASPWDREPNMAPCSGWARCGRDYELVEYDASSVTQQELSRRTVLTVSAQGARWL